MRVNKEGKPNLQMNRENILQEHITNRQDATGARGRLK